MAKKSKDNKSEGNIGVIDSKSSNKVMSMSNKKVKANRKRKSKIIYPEHILKETPIFDLLHNFEKAPDQWAGRYTLILAAIVLRSAVGLGSYSGMGQKPINGDFEAQRHWMEMTINLPITEWYWFDLQYWGLDYPPLTAYHSYICGKLGSFINESWFALNVSRGLETPSLKTFMRLTALISEMVFFIPALITFVTLMGKKLKITRMDQIVILFIIMWQPSLILIDHGHFQYNSVMLGLCLFTLSELISDHYVLASVWFVLCISFKQMGLYYAPFIFFHLLSKTFNNIHDTKNWSIFKDFNFRRLISIGVTVIITILVVFAPFVIAASNNEEALNQIKQIFIRMFPFQRGIFEDKVANFWCTSNIVIKYKNLFKLEELTRLSLLLTLISILPPCAMIFYKNVFSMGFSERHERTSKNLALIYGLASTAWGFYLFSFQVHEKTVLVPLIPSTLLFIIGDFHVIAITQWINNIAVFSMWPLLKKDGLALQYILLVFLSNFLVGAFNLRKSTLMPPKSLFWKLVVGLSYLAVIVVHLIDLCYLPPAKYPDLWVIFNTTLSFACFSIYWLWLLYRMYQL